MSLVCRRWSTLGWIFLGTFRHEYRGDAFYKNVSAQGLWPQESPSPEVQKSDSEAVREYRRMVRLQRPACSQSWIRDIVALLIDRACEHLLVKARLTA